MKSILTAAFAAGALAVTATQPAAAQATSTINIAGIPFYCNSNMGTLVPIYHTETAQQGGGAMAGYNNYRGFFIDVSPSYMSSINAYAAAFVFLHECAHVALPFGIGMGTFYQESNADCWAIQRMRDFGMIQNHYQFEAAISAVANSPGSPMGHLPGPQRIQNAWQCLHF